MEKLLEQINERVQALGEQVSEARLKEIVQTELNLLWEDQEFIRKMRFGSSGERKLFGSKFHRFGFEIADVEFLFDLMEARQRAGMGSGPSEELRNAFGHISQAIYVPEDEIRKIDQQALDGVFSRIPVRWFPLEDQALAARGAWMETQAYQNAMRAMDTAESGYGSQLIGAQYVADLWEGARRDSRIFSLIETFEMTAPTAYLPVEADIPEMLFVTENTAADSSEYGTSKTGSNRVQVDAKKFVLHQMWSGEMEEDSIIPYIPFLRRQASKSLSHYSDSLVLNGDTTNAATGNINLDDADPADTKHYLAVDGIRHVFLADNTDNQTDHSGAAVTYNALVRLKKLLLDTTYLHDWGHPINPQDLVYIVNPDLGDEISLLDETLTVDKYGQNAMVVTGEITKVGQNPVVPSIAMSKTEADGKVSTTGANNTLGQAALFNRNGYKAGWRRRVKVETERLPARDQTRIVYSMRLGLGRFSPTGAASGIEHTAGLFNIA